MRYKWAIIALAALGTTGGPSRGAGGATIGAAGASTTVAQGAAGPLQCVLTSLASRGYPVRFIRGYGHGSVPGSLHPAGMALDVNQTSRNRTTPRMPHDEIEMASACGAISGASWGGSPDSGHFQVGGWNGIGGGVRRHMRHRHHRR